MGVKAKAVKKHTKEQRRQIDKKVGENLRAIRGAKGLSQHQLSSQIDLTFQQLQKYERGTNRISASVLFELSEILKIDIEQFFRGLSTSLKPARAPLKKEQEELLHYFEALPKEGQKSLLKLLKTAAKGGGNA